MPFYYQILKRKVFICLQGHQHHIRDGAAVDTDHTCEESVVVNVVRQFLHTQEGSTVRWNCRGCRHRYHSGTPKCNKSLCAAIRGHTLAQVVDLTLSQIETMLHSVTSWDPLAEDSEAPETLSGHMLAVFLLSPHNQNLGGLTAANWEVICPEDDIGTCRCSLLREQQELLEQDSTPPIIQEVEVKGYPRDRPTILEYPRDRPTIREY